MGRYGDHIMMGRQSPAWLLSSCGLRELSPTHVPPMRKVHRISTYVVLWKNILPCPGGVPILTERMPGPGGLLASPFASSGVKLYLFIYLFNRRQPKPTKLIRDIRNPNPVLMAEARPPRLSGVKLL
jgi:hypothetical protein